MCVKMERFADVLMPLPLDGAFTYSIPAELETEISPGCRVFVPFGRRKYYTGIVISVHTDKPKGFETKEIIRIINPQNITRYPQIKFWNWLSNYYLCTLGDVYKAAVPTGLRVESETIVRLNPDYDSEYNIKLTERQALIIAELQSKGKCSLHELDKLCDYKNISSAISQLLTARIIEIDERAVEKYRAVKKIMIRLCCERFDETSMHAIFELLKGSPVQEKILLTYLDISGWMLRDKELIEVEKSQLIEKTGTTLGTLKRMIDKGVFEVYQKTLNRFNATSAQTSSVPIILSDAQNRALQDIRDSFRAKKVVLLRGVTGSGKTEIYSQMMRETIEKGQQVLYLVPEISLTTQLTDRLRRLFGDKLLVYHSKFTDSERVDLWMRLLNTREPLIILGARSAVFMPFSNLGLVVVDEEHESSYKQNEPAPRYNARDAAIVLASFWGAFTILGSATPSVETYYKACEGKYGLVELKERYSDAQLPEVRIVDMKAQRKQKLNKGSLSQPLMQEINKSLGASRQAIIFQNRRGFAPMIQCRECGWTPKCLNCDVSLVYHKSTGLLRCHYCGHSVQLPTLCPACGLNGIEIFGYGTERIAEETLSVFPEAKISRMDLDTTRNKNAHQQIIDEFSKHKTDILVGTQMVSKGLDFEKVDVVGVVNADTMLNYPDFRGNERAFNMLEQVSGRAGRHSKDGVVIIQTTNPKNEVLKHVVNHDYDGFYKEEIANRKQFAYPPFTRVINVFLKHRDSRIVDSMAVNYVLQLRKIFGARVLGPEKPYVSRVANWNIQTVMLKIESGASMQKVKAILRSVYVEMSKQPQFRGVVLYFDVDPA